MHNGIRLFFRQQRIDQGGVTNIAMHKPVAGISGDAVQVFQIAGVGELIQIDHTWRLIAGKKEAYKRGANESGAAGDEEFHFV
jgi:hypothetical protein